MNKLKFEVYKTGNSVMVILHSDDACIHYAGIGHSIADAIFDLFISNNLVRKSIVYNCSADMVTVSADSLVNFNPFTIRVQGSSCINCELELV